MKVLFFLWVCVCYISCHGQNTLEGKANDSSINVKIKLLPLEASKPTTLDSTFIPEQKLIHLKLYSDGGIGYKLHVDSAYQKIIKDQIKQILDKYPDRDVAIIKGDQNANYELFKEVVGIIKTREKKKFYLITE